jgi:hypothetical protein
MSEFYRAETEEMEWAVEDHPRLLQNIPAIRSLINYDRGPDQQKARQ